MNAIHERPACPHCAAPLYFSERYPDGTCLCEGRTTRTLPRRLYLDDQRVCPAGWVPCRTPDDFRYLVTNFDWDEISFDYDLSDHISSGFDLLKWMFVKGFRPRHKPMVHTGLRNKGREMEQFIKDTWKP